MLSICNDAPPEGRILSAAATCVRDFGVERVTVAEIARRAGVSRPTVYRRWPDTRSIIGALLTSRITGILAQAPEAGQDRESLVRQIVAVATALRHDELVMTVLHSSLAQTYITERLGTSQQILIDGLVARLVAGQVDGSVRAGDCRHMAAMVLLIVQSSIQSAQIVAPILDGDALAVELDHSLNGYLAP